MRLNETALGGTRGSTVIYLRPASTRSNPQNDLGTQGRITGKLMMRALGSMCGPQIEIGQQEGVFGD